MTLREEIINTLKSRPGYRFSETKLDAALERGIRDGDVIYSNTAMTVRVEGGFAIARDPNGAQIGPAMDLSIPKHAQDCLKMYASRAAQAV